MLKEYDSLTQILSRESVISYIANKMSNESKIGVAIIDVDFFVNIDSKVGSKEGDRILYRIAQYLNGKEDMVVGRYGGDEFILAFENQDYEEVSGIFQSIRRDFRRQRFISSDSIYAKVPITISIGITFNEGKDQLMDTLKASETALAMAKKRGRNQVVILEKYNALILTEDNAAVATYAGCGLRGADNNKTAVKAKILEPYGVDLAEEGELLFADRGNHRIIKVNKNGKIEAIAGKGSYGYSGDFEDAKEAKLNKPSGVAVDKVNRNIFVADTGNHCIRRIDGEGIITTYAGCGIEGYEGDGNKAVHSRLSRPGGVVVDKKGNVYTNDYGNNVIRMITPDGYIHTVAGSGEFGYKGDGGNPLCAAMDRPYGLAVTKKGEKMYIADYGNHCIREVDLSRRIISTICGNGAAGYDGDGGIGTNAKLNGPFWVCLWGSSYLLIADGENNCIRIYDFYTKIINTLVGNGQFGYKDGKTTADTILLNIPAGMVVDEKNSRMYIADYGNNAIRRVNLREFQLKR